MESCPTCGGPLVPLGALGALEYARCRNCGSVTVVVFEPETEETA